MQDFRLQKDARKNELEQELSKISLALRYDSRLCSCYINGITTPDWTAPKVAKECATMHWLHNFTDYEGRCAAAASEESNKLWFHGGRHFADHMKRRVYPVIKDTILKENDGGPTSWPWIKTNKTSEDSSTSST